MIVDESGSMSPSRSTTVSAINDYLQGLKTSLPADTRVTVVKFDSGYVSTRPINIGGVDVITSLGSTDRVNISKLFDQTPLQDVRVITEADYAPRGGTPLHDAIGRTVTGLDKTVAVEPAPVFLTILTDGEENESTEFTLAAIKSLIEQRTTQGWTITFMGVDIDAYAAGARYGVRQTSTVALKRNKIDEAAGALTRSTTSLYASSVAMASSGSSFADYGRTNSTMDTFTAEEKGNLETDEPVKAKKAKTET